MVLSSRESMTARLLDCAVGVSDDGFSYHVTHGGRAWHQGTGSEGPWRGMCMALDRRQVKISRSHVLGLLWPACFWDYSRGFTGCFDGFQYKVICRRSHFIRIYPVREKSAATFITEALEPLSVFVTTMHPGTFLQSIHGDSDSAVLQWGHGEHLLPPHSSWLGFPQTYTL